MIRRTALMLAPLVALLACDSNQSLVEPEASEVPVQLSAAGGRAATTGVVFVTGQGLYYDTFATAASLPPHGRFQKLESDGSTQFGPGDPGYLGGRWWVDENGNNVQDAGDTYFLCPLLGPGRPNP